MSRKNAILPLARESSTRLLPWIVGVMVYVAAVILAGAMTLTGVASTWSRDLSDTFTVQIPPLDNASPDRADRMDKAVALLRETPGIAEVRLVSAEATLRLLEPWLGPDLDTHDLPLPQMIDVRRAGNARLDFDVLGARLAEAVPGAVVINNEVWRDQVLRLVHSLEVLATVIVVLIGFCCMIAVIFATRSGVAVHRDVIEVLHLIGATDDYIAGQFQRQAFYITLVGSLVGAGFAAATVMLLARIAGDLDSLLLPRLQLDYWQWSALAIIPLLTSLIATTTARRTVMRALRRMP